jgi:hypothetical protein
MVDGTWIVSTVLRVGLAFMLLYKILGWRCVFLSVVHMKFKPDESNSAFVGIGILIISLPVPAYLVKMRHSVQQKQMKKVHLAPLSPTVYSHPL